MVAKEAMKRKGGARGLRAILEGIMLDIMYEVLIQNRVSEVVINEDVILKGTKPMVVHGSKNEEKEKKDETAVA